MELGFSPLGLGFLLALLIPNLLWTKHKPEGYEAHAVRESRRLRLLEMLGEVLVSLFAVVIPQGPWGWRGWLLFSLLGIVLYEFWWIRYFRSPRRMKDLYSSLLGIPVAGATLPVATFFLLGLYQRNFLLLPSVVVLGIGHIGIHLGHKRELEE